MEGNYKSYNIYIFIGLLVFTSKLLIWRSVADVMALKTEREKEDHKTGRRPCIFKAYLIVTISMSRYCLAFLKQHKIH